MSHFSMRLGMVVSVSTGVMAKVDRSRTKSMLGGILALGGRSGVN